MPEKILEELLSNEDFLEAILNLDTGEKVRKMLAENGICLTESEVDKFAEALVRALNKKLGKIQNETEMENVGGGAEIWGTAAENCADLVWRGGKRFKEKNTGYLLRGLSLGC